jgi:hypothetical protein
MRFNFDFGGKMGNTMKAVFFGILILLGSLFCFQCQDSNLEKIKDCQKDSTKTVHIDQIEDSTVFNFYLLDVKENLTWLSSLKSNDTLNVLLLLNRVDQDHLLRQDTLVMPDKIYANLNLYCPFPEIIEPLKTIHKIIFVSRYAQAFAVYEKGLRVRWGAASLGKESTPTPAGLYFTNWKAKKTTSTVNRSWVLEWSFNLDNYKGISMHEFSLPGYPASHSCIRLFRDDANWLYYWADQWILSEYTNIAAYGTPVIVYGSYPFDEIKPWHRLATNNKALRVTKKDILMESDKYLPLIRKRQYQRDSVALMLKVDSLGGFL